MRSISGLIKFVLLIGIGGLSGLLLINMGRGYWAGIGIDVVLIASLAVLFYVLNRWPQWERPIGISMASMLIGVPLLLLGRQPQDIGGLLPMLALCAVLILAILWPVAGLVATAVETGVLLWLSLWLDLISPYVAAGFATAGIIGCLIARSLLEALSADQVTQAALTEKNQILQQTMERLESVIEQDQLRMQTIRELEMPLIESERGDGILVVVGYCTADRVQLIQERLFTRLKQHSFRRLILDISGASFDQEGMSAWVQTLRTLRLIVSNIVVSGMSSRQAQELAQDRDKMTLLRETVQFVHSLQDAFG